MLRRFPVKSWPRPAYRRLQADERVASCSSEAPSCLPVTPMTSSRCGRSVGRWGSPSRCSTTTFRASVRSSRQRLRSLEVFLELIDENALAYRKLMQSVSSVPEVREIVDEVRTRTAARILDGLYPDGTPPKARVAVSGWLWFMDGACLNWIEHRDLSRDELRDLLLGTLLGALTAADAVPLEAVGEEASAAAARS